MRFFKQDISIREKEKFHTWIAFSRKLAGNANSEKSRF